jgi:hypothetical protein
MAMHSGFIIARHRSVTVTSDLTSWVDPRRLTTPSLSSVVWVTRAELANGRDIDSGTLFLLCCQTEHW